MPLATQPTKRSPYDLLLVVVLCALSVLIGYTIGRGPKRKHRKTIVQSELEKQQPPRKAAPAKPAPKRQTALARLESVSAYREETEVEVRFTTPVVKAQAEEASRYTVEPAVKVLAATLAGDGRTVTLTTSPLKRDIPYRLTVSNVAIPPAAPDDMRAIFRYLGTRRVLDGLVALYTFEDGEGDIVKDASRFGEPMDLRIVDTKATEWIAGGLAIKANSHVVSAGDGTKIIQACRASNAITIEAWLKPANTRQGGPARIVTLSRGSADRNFTLGQEGPRYYVRLRTTQRDNNGEPALASQGGVAEALTHVVYTRSGDGKVVVTINGQPNIAANVPGDFSNWTAFPFGLANEFDTRRTWLGELHLVALYSRALSPTEIAQNFEAGPEGKTPQE